MIGWFTDFRPKFVRRYADLKSIISAAAGDYAADVRSRRFPAAAETYALTPGAQPGSSSRRQPRVARADKRG